MIPQTRGMAARAVKAAEACCGSCSALSASAAGDCAGREGMLTMAKVRGASWADWVVVAAVVRWRGRRSSLLLSSAAAAAVAAAAGVVAGTGARWARKPAAEEADKEMAGAEDVGGTLAERADMVQVLLLWFWWFRDRVCRIEF